MRHSGRRSNIHEHSGTSVENVSGTNGTAGCLLIGMGILENEPAGVRNCEVSDKGSLTHWFIYRKKIVSGRSLAIAGRRPSLEKSNPTAGLPSTRRNC
jgi:hypothetical protein